MFDDYSPQYLNYTTDESKNHAARAAVWNSDSPDEAYDRVQSRFPLMGITRSYIQAMWNLTERIYTLRIELRGLPKDLRNATPEYRNWHGGPFGNEDEQAGSSRRNAIYREIAKLEANMKSIQLNDYPD